ncbi:hypothetical protein NW754_007850 [Fusarium falciforme]|nr:hypothetical protein NW754_007850 [Fusarium falciforme]
MKEAFIIPDIQVEIREVPIPIPKAGDLLIKVAVSGTNPKDWKVPIFLQKSVNSGDDFSGIVEAVGAGVSEFKPGDRVAGMHEIGTAHGSFAEFAITPASTTFHIPDNVTFEEAVTIPLNGLAAAYDLCHVLRLPAPWSPAGIEKTPLVIHAEIQSAIVKAGGGPAWYGLDCATNHDGAPEYKGVVDGALGLQAGLEDSAGRKPLVATVQAGSKFTGHVDGGDINVMVAHTGSNEEKCLAYTDSRLFAYGLASGWLTGHPTEVVEGGLDGVGEALRRLKSEQVFGKKLIIKIGEL